MSNWSRDSLGTRNLSEVSVSVSIVGNGLALDLSTATTFNVNLNANIGSITITNTPSPGVVAFTIVFTADGTLRTVNWGGSILWPNNLPPTLTSTNNAKDVFSFVTFDGGTTWLGFTGGQKF